MLQFVWSGRADLNRGPPAPKAGALPGCATPRLNCSTDSKSLPRTCVHEGPRGSLRFCCVLVANCVRTNLIQPRSVVTQFLVHVLLVCHPVQLYQSLAFHLQLRLGILL